ncbi:MAG: hypothetical protein WC048_08915 [Rhizobium sp.]
MSAFRYRKESADAGIDLLPPERRARTMHRHSFIGPADIVDAHFVTIRDIPRPDFARRRFNDNEPFPGMFRRPDGRASPARLLGAAIGSVETLLERLSDRSYAVLVASVFSGVFALAGVLSGSGTSSMQSIPDASALDITHVSLTPQDANGMRVLLINAIVENRSTGRVHVPTVRADLLSNGEIVASTLIAAPVDVIDAGHSRGFSARLQHPGGKLPELRLSFAEADASSI